VRPLSPATRQQYEDVLIAAFGSASPPYAFKESLDKWSHGRKLRLRAAILRVGTELGTDLTATADQVRIQYVKQKAPRIPTEDEGTAYLAAAKKLPVGIRSAVALPVLLGLRADEVLGLTRTAVSRAAATGELLVSRKGGEEQFLKAGPYRAVFDDLLLAHAHSKGSTIENPLRLRLQKWMTVGQILSGGDRRSQYVALWRRVKTCAASAGFEASPHAFRHLFATRMIKDGAPLPAVQQFLNHKNIQTTMRYLHLDTSVGAGYLRPL
jgi:site-specific recombinase XerD